MQRKISDYFELLPKDVVKEVVKNLPLETAQEAAKASPILDAATQAVWRERYQRDFPKAMSKMTNEEIASQKNWMLKYSMTEDDAYQSLTTMVRSSFRSMKQGEYAADMQADLELDDLLICDKSEHQSLLSIAIDSGNQTLLNHFYQLANRSIILACYSFYQLDNQSIILAGYSMLHLAVLTNQSPETILDLVKQGWRLDGIYDHKTALILAAENRRDKLVLTLLQLGANTAVRDIWRHSALTIAASKNYPDIVHTLLAGGPSTNRCKIIPDEDEHPLTKAVTKGYREVVQVILEESKNRELIDNLKHRTALHYAAKSGQMEILNYLLSLNVNVDAADINGMTPLHLAIKHGRHDAVISLLEKKADVNRKMNNGCTPLFLACHYGRDQDFNVLLQHGADLAAAKDNNMKLTPLYAAAMNNHNNVVIQLLKHGVDINEQSIDGRTALYIAAKRGFQLTAELLLSECANPDISTNFGLTPLYIAASKGNLDMAKLLMRFNAHPGKPTLGTKLLPHEKAIRCGHIVVARAIENYAKSVNTNRLFGWYRNQKKHQQSEMMAEHKSSLKSP